MNFKKIIDNSFSTLTPLTANEEIIKNGKPKKIKRKKAVCRSMRGGSSGDSGDNYCGGSERLELCRYV